MVHLPNLLSRSAVTAAVLISGLFLGNTANADIKMKCSNIAGIISLAGGVSKRSGKEKYIGASLRTKKGDIIDLPPVSISISPAWTKRARGVVEYRVSTWEGKSGGYMKGRVQDTQWRRCR